MTAGRMMTALGALALGFATAGAIPALAQTGTAGSSQANASGTNATTGNQTGGSSGMTTAQTNGTAGATGSNMTGTTGTGANTTNNGSGTTGSMTTGQTNASGGTGQMNGSSNMATTGQNQPQPTSRTGMANEGTHHATRRMHTASRRGMGNQNPDAQISQVARLNDQSLHAAQRGRASHRRAPAAICNPARPRLGAGGAHRVPPLLFTPADRPAGRADRMPRLSLAIAFSLDPSRRAVVQEMLGETADAAYLKELDPTARAAALRAAAVLLAWNTAKDLRPNEAPLLAGARLVQFMTAGVDFIPLSDLPPDVPVASNGGAYAEPMAEHALAMAFAAAKRLPIEQAAMARGQFNQATQNRMLSAPCAAYWALAASASRWPGWRAASACRCTPSTAAAAPMNRSTGSVRRTG